jgi:hypothetical protein
MHYNFIEYAFPGRRTRCERSVYNHILPIEDHEIAGENENDFRRQESDNTSRNEYAEQSDQPQPLVLITGSQRIMKFPLILLTSL